MSQNDRTLFEDKVRKEWVDYNGHMSDSEYSRVFSKGVDRVMKTIGITDEFREKEQYTIYTLETHLCYLQETMEGNPLRITFQLLDHDEKRLHVFFVMEDGDGNRLATSEQMLMGVDLKERRSAPFPPVVMEKVKVIAGEDEKKQKPKEAGRVIGIRRK